MHVGQVLQDVLNRFHITAYQLMKASGVGHSTIRKLMADEISTTSAINLRKIARGLRSIDFYAEGAFWHGLQQDRFDDYLPAPNKDVWYQETPQHIGAVIQALRDLNLLDESALKAAVEGVRKVQMDHGTFSFTLEEWVMLQMQTNRHQDADQGSDMVYYETTVDADEQSERDEMEVHDHEDS